MTTNSYQQQNLKIQKQKQNNVHEQLGQEKINRNGDHMEGY